LTLLQSLPCAAGNTASAWCRSNHPAAENRLMDAKDQQTLLSTSRTHLIWKAFPIIVSLIGVAAAINILLQFK
jgi:hypothetical protein